MADTKITQLPAAAAAQATELIAVVQDVPTVPETRKAVFGRGIASGLATLDASVKVVQDPANATATPTGSKIPIADAAGKLDAWVSDISAKGIKTADQIIATATVTIVIWPAEEYDTDTMHDNTTNNSRMTIKTAGKYLILFTASWASNNIGIRQLGLNKNGVELFNIIFPNNNAGMDNNQILSLQNLAVNDYIEVYVYQASGGNLTLNYLYGTSLIIKKLG